MSDYTELIKSLRICGSGICHECMYEKQIGCIDNMELDAATAIEELQAKVHEKDCFIGMLKVQMGNMEQQIPKHGEWIELEDRNERKYSHICSVCHRFNIEEGEVEFYHYCPNCGAKMSTQSNDSNALDALDGKE